MAYSDRFPQGMLARARQAGADYILPDSAERLPDSLWERLDPEAVMEAVDRLNDHLDAGTVVRKDGVEVRPTIFWMSEEEKARLRAMGGPATEKMIRDHEELDRRLGGPTI